jgi:hypothetical protein
MKEYTRTQVAQVSDSEGWAPGRNRCGGALNRATVEVFAEVGPAMLEAFEKAASPREMIDLLVTEHGFTLLETDYKDVQYTNAYRPVSRRDNNNVVRFIVSFDSRGRFSYQLQEWWRPA